MTAATDPLTPIFNALVGELPYSPSGRGAFAVSPGSVCTPVEWFGTASPVHGRDQGATQVMPVVQEGAA